MIERGETMRHESELLQSGDGEIMQPTAAEAAELDALQLTAEDLQTLAEMRQSMESGELRAQLDQMHAELAAELAALDQSGDQISGAGGADQ